MISGDDLLKLVSAGLTAEQLAVVAEVMNNVTRNAEVTPKNANAIRQQRHREKVRALRGNGLVTPVTDSNASPVTNVTPPPAPLAHVDDNLLFQEIEPQESKEEKKERGVTLSFDRFWAMFPNKVGKADAIKAFRKAIDRTDLDSMLGALERYASKTDDRPWCNPSTWLNQDRWTDQPAAVARGSPPRQGQSDTERRKQELAERIRSEHGIGREDGGYPEDAGRMARLLAGPRV